MSLLTYYQFYLGRPAAGGVVEPPEVLAGDLLDAVQVALDDSDFVAAAVEDGGLGQVLPRYRKVWRNEPSPRVQLPFVVIEEDIPGDISDTRGGLATQPRRVRFDVYAASVPAVRTLAFAIQSYFNQKGAAPRLEWTDGKEATRRADRAEPEEVPAYERWMDGQNVHTRRVRITWTTQFRTRPAVA